VPVGIALTFGFVLLLDCCCYSAQLLTFTLLLGTTFVLLRSLLLQFLVVTLFRLFDWLLFLYVVVVTLPVCLGRCYVAYLLDLVGLPFTFT